MWIRPETEDFLRDSCVYSSYLQLCQQRGYSGNQADFHTPIVRNFKLILWGKIMLLFGHGIIF